MKQDISVDGFVIINNVFTGEEIDYLLSTISNADTSKPTFRKRGDLFAIRQLFIEIPSIVEMVFNHRLQKIISEMFGDDFFW
jgi:hypothetical protein